MGFFQNAGQAFSNLVGGAGDAAGGFLGGILGGALGGVADSGIINQAGDVLQGLGNTNFGANLGSSLGGGQGASKEGGGDDTEKWYKAKWVAPVGIGLGVLTVIGIVVAIKKGNKGGKP